MQVLGARCRRLGVCIALLTLTFLFTYMLTKPLSVDIFPETRPSVPVDTSQRAQAVIRKQEKEVNTPYETTRSPSGEWPPPALESVWKHFATNTSELSPGLLKAIELLKGYVLTEATGLTYQMLLEAYFTRKPLTFPSLPAPLQIVIVTTWRSGSTFTEKLLDSHPAIFDLYEPLSYLNLRRARRGSSAKNALAIVKDALQCRFTNARFLETVNKVQGMKDSDASKFCQGPPNVCNDPKFISQSCLVFPWTLMKIVRLPLALMKPFLEEPVSSNLQIIYLVRDPRAVINSRRSTVKWCTPSNKECYLPSVLCEDMEQDLQAYYKFKELYPDHIHMIRYEDIMNDVMNQSKILVERIGLNFTKSMMEFVQAHSTKEVDNAWTTSRVSKAHLLHWTSKLSMLELHNVQNTCAQTMEKFGYKTVRTVANLTLDDVLTNMKGNL